MKTMKIMIVFLSLLVIYACNEDFVEKQMDIIDLKQSVTYSDYNFYGELHNDILHNFRSIKNSIHDSTHFDYIVEETGIKYVKYSLIDTIINASKSMLISRFGISSNQYDSISQAVYNNFDDSGMLVTINSVTCLKQFDGNMASILNNNLSNGIDTANYMRLLTFCNLFDSKNLIGMQSFISNISTTNYDIEEDSVLFIFKNVFEHSELHWSETINCIENSSFGFNSKYELKKKEQLKLQDLSVEEYASFVGNAVDGIVAGVFSPYVLTPVTAIVLALGSAGSSAAATALILDYYGCNCAVCNYYN